jgi:hypothetical protein
MNRIATAAALAVALALTGATLAQDKPAAKPPAAQPGPRGPGMGMPMTEQDRTQMQERMRLMQQQMDRLHKTTDPAERQKLLDEHYKLMEAQMATMRGMGGGMMMGMGGGGMMGPGGQGMMGPGGAPKSGGPGKPPAPDQRMRMMEDRMDMMQMMMEQMQGQMMEQRRPQGR